nr:hypothetical protein [Bacillus infantis]
MMGFWVLVIDGIVDFGERQDCADGIICSWWGRGGRDVGMCG